MCGIVMVGKLNSDLNPKLHKKIMRFFTVELLLQSQSRGTDGTGLALCFGDGEVFGIKRSEKAEDFACFEEDHNLKTILKVWDKKDAVLAIGHCRKASVGSKDVVNTQPFLIGNILGVHNGTLRNHEKIKDKLKLEPEGDVDSELIFHILKNEFSEEVSFDLAEKTVNKLRGAFAVLAVDVNNPTKILGFRDARPLITAVDEKLGLFIVASESKFITEVEYLYNRLKYLYKHKWPEADFDITTLSDDTAILIDLETQTIETKAMPKTAQRDKNFDTTSANNSAYGYNGYNGYSYTGQDWKRYNGKSGYIWNERTNSYESSDDIKTDFPSSITSNLIAERKDENREYPLMSVELVEVGSTDKTSPIGKEPDHKKKKSGQESKQVEELAKVKPMSLANALEIFKKSDVSKSVIEIEAFKAGWYACLGLFTKPKLAKIRLKKATLEGHLVTLKMALKSTVKMLTGVPDCLKNKKNDIKVDIDRLKKVIKDEEVIKVFED